MLPALENCAISEQLLTGAADTVDVGVACESVEPVEDAPVSVVGVGFDVDDCSVVEVAFDAKLHALSVSIRVSERTRAMKMKPKERFRAGCGVCGAYVRGSCLWRMA